MNCAEIIGIAICFVFILGGCLDVIALYTSARYVRQINSTISNYKDVPHIHILLPLFNEQSIIKDSYAHYTNLTLGVRNCTVYFITTEKEIAQGNKRTTAELLEELDVSQNCIHLHYPYKDGIMAHQLNWAVKLLGNGSYSADPKDLVLVYNADSRVTCSQIQMVRDAFYNSCFPRYAIQQIALYPVPQRASHHGVIASATNWQNRWSLCFELPRIFFLHNIAKISQKRHWSFVKLASPFMYVIGHGLAIRIDSLINLGYFPEKTLNEDAALGLLMYHSGYVLDTIPSFETSEFVAHWKTYVQQQSSWFSGPSRAINYAWNCNKIYQAADKTHCRLLTIYDKIGLHISAIKLFMHAIYWIIGPFLLLIVLPVTIIATCRPYLAILAVVTMLFYLKYIPHLVQKQIRLLAPTISLGEVSISGGLIAYALHGLGALMNIVLTINGKNNCENKPKTPRNNET